MSLAEEPKNPRTRHHESLGPLFFLPFIGSVSRDTRDTPARRFSTSSSSLLSRQLPSVIKFRDIYERLVATPKRLPQTTPGRQALFTRLRFIGGYATLGRGVSGQGSVSMSKRYSSTGVKEIVAPVRE